VKVLKDVDSPARPSRLHTGCEIDFQSTVPGLDVPLSHVDQVEIAEASRRVGHAGGQPRRAPLCNA
jgi:hypothetical protein